MKITIEINSKLINAIKAYNKAFDEPTTKNSLKIIFESWIEGQIENSAISDYIKN